MKTRSMGVKFVIVCGLALLMTVPALFVGGLVSEREQRASQVKAEITKDVGGAQTFLGPTLAVPYTVKPTNTKQPATQGTYIVFPEEASAVLKTSTQERHRSLFRVPVYQADVQFSASFPAPDLSAVNSTAAYFDWSRAEIIVGVSDPHGALTDATLSIEGKTLTLTPADLSDTLPLGKDDKLVLLGARVGDAVAPNRAFDLTSALRFSGAERVSMLAYGKTTRLTVTGDWRNPGFTGGILPVSRSMTDHGFTASWSVPFIARGVRAQGPIDTITGLNTTAMGVSFIEVADAYQSVDRSLKYTLLFVGLVFLSYFLFEVSTGTRVHPAQYILVGIAQIIFYLLLLSLSERIGFDLAFLAGGAATVVLLSTNAGWVFAGRRETVRALLIFSALYTLIYSLLRLEDNALLVGAIASFLAIAAAMYVTRRIDWYGTAAAATLRATPHFDSGYFFRGDRI